jgi:hypothetical protein
VTLLHPGEAARPTLVPTYGRREDFFVGRGGGDMTPATVQQARPVHDDRVARPRRWWHRRATPHPLQQLDDAREVLDRARAMIERGWVQNRWYVLAPRPQGRRSSLLRSAIVAPDEVAAACLVGALALALREHDPRADLLSGGGAALDAVWDAVRDAGGTSDPPTGRRPWPREARLLRVRDLTRWNDRPGRTRDEVLAVLDDASSRVIMAAMRGPVPATP